MNISPISSVTDSSRTSLDAYVQNNTVDFNSMKSALQAGNLTDTPATFEMWLQYIQNDPRMQELLKTNSQISQDFQAVQSALKSGDMTSAKAALTTLQQDYQTQLQSSLSSVHRHPHHHHPHGVQSVAGSSTTGTTGSTGSSATNLLT